MELLLQLISFPLIATFFLIILLSMLTLRTKPEPTRLNPNLPPGPRKLPIIGNIHNISGSLPHHAFRDLAKKYGPLMHLRIGAVPTVVVSSAEVAKEVLKTHGTTFGSRPSVLAAEILFYDRVDIIFSPYGDYWRQLRKICTLQLLSAKRVESFWRIREEEVMGLVERIRPNTGSPFNLTENIFSLSYSITARTAFGKKYKGQNRFISLIADNVKLASGFDIADVFPSLTWLHVLSGTRPKLKNMHREIDEIMEAILNEHREARDNGTSNGEEAEDLVDVLLKYEGTDDGFSMSTKNIKAVIFDMFGGGSETSATTVDWAIAEMMKEPEIMKKAQAEVRRVFDGRGKVVEEDIPRLNYLDSVLKETLRVHPPGPLIHRECRESCEVDGYQIPEKTTMMVNVWAIGRDPKYWANPETFDPERFVESPMDYIGNIFNYIPFGAGRRVCPGMNFGLANMKYELAMLLYHFDWELPSGTKNDELDMTESFGLSVRRKQDMILIPTPYRPPKIVPEN